MNLIERIERIEERVCVFGRLLSELAEQTGYVFEDDFEMQPALCHSEESPTEDEEEVSENYWVIVSKVDCKKEPDGEDYYFDNDGTEDMPWTSVEGMAYGFKSEAAARQHLKRIKKPPRNHLKPVVAHCNQLNEGTVGGRAGDIYIIEAKNRKGEKSYWTGMVWNPDRKEAEPFDFWKEAQDQLESVVDYPPRGYGKPKIV